MTRIVRVIHATRVMTIDVIADDEFAAHEAAYQHTLTDRYLAREDWTVTKVETNADGSFAVWFRRI